jgi:cytoskeleton protein RodZ
MGAAAKADIEETDIGADLRTAREQRGFSLEQLSNRIKVSVRNLQSIETDQFHNLPQPIFVRGFLRAYSREVGLDPEEIVARFLNHFRQAETLEAPPPPRIAVVKTDPVREVADGAVAGGISTVRADWVIIALLVFLLGYGLVAWRAQRESHPPATSAAPQAIAPAPTPMATPHREVGTSGSALPAVSAPASDVLRLTIKAQESCWVSLTTDGTRTLYRLMRPRETQTFEVHDEAVLRVGDPEAFAFTINGGPGRPLGGDGEPITVHINTQNYRDFLANSSSPRR